MITVIIVRVVIMIVYNTRIDSNDSNKNEKKHIKDNNNHSSNKINSTINTHDN